GGLIAWTSVSTTRVQAVPKQPTGTRQRVRTLAGGSDANDEGSPFLDAAAAADGHIDYQPIVLGTEV
ncbi:MAG: hypothetical protein WBQ26_01895, partial [Gemmatimonadaceae bacterium]